MGWAPVSNEIYGCHLANAWRIRSKKHPSVAVLYCNEVSVSNQFNSMFASNCLPRLTLWRRLGRLWPTRIDPRIDPISPRAPARLGLACTQQTHCGLHNIDFLTYSDDHPSRQSGLCPSRERSRTSTKDINGLYRSLPAVFEWMSASKGYTMHFNVVV